MYKERKIELRIRIGKKDGPLDELEKKLSWKTKF
jgi:hypothetical protein